MLQLDKVLDNSPKEKDVIRMAELRIRNLQAFAELQAYNDSGKWKYRHPLIIHMSERFSLEELKRKDPAGFLREYTNCSHNVKRYTSYLKNQSRADKRDSDKRNLQKHKEREIIFKDIIANENS